MSALAEARAVLLFGFGHPQNVSTAEAVVVVIGALVFIVGIALLVRAMLRSLR